jgi:hypothetical protein
VYTAGNYKTLEFAKIGAPFQVYLLIVSAFILHFMDDWHTVWIISWVAVAAFIAIPAAWSVIPNRLTLPIEEFFDRLGARISLAVAPLKFWRRRRSDGSFRRTESDGELHYVQNSDPSTEGSDGKNAKVPKLPALPASAAAR